MLNKLMMIVLILSLNACSQVDSSPQKKIELKGHRAGKGVYYYYAYIDGQIRWAFAPQMLWEYVAPHRVAIEYV